MFAKIQYRTCIGRWIHFAIATTAAIVICIFIDKSLSVVDCLLCVTTVLCTCFCAFDSFRKSKLRIIHGFVQFIILIVAYYDHSPYPREYVLVPIVISNLIYIYPMYLNIILMIGIGIIANLVLSYNFYLTNKIDLISFVIYTATVVFFIVFEFLYLRINRLKNMIKHQENKIDHIVALNSSFSDQIFALQKKVSLEERKKITKQIHDTAGYVFTNIIMMLQAADAVMEIDNEKAKKMIDNALDYSRRGINEIRYILREMREENQGPQSIQNELYEITKTFSMASNCNVNIEYGNWPQTFNPDYDVFFIHLVQESLTNAIKHGNAEHVSIICWKNDDSITMSVSDDGIGANAGTVKFGIGLDGIYEFVTKNNGKLEFPPVDKGFSILVTLPLL